VPGLGGVANYFNIDNNWEILQISVKKDKSFDDDTPDWIQKLFKCMATNGPLTITVLDSNHFIISNTQGNDDLTMLFTFPLDLDPLSISKSVVNDGEKHSDSVGIDIIDYFDERFFRYIENSFNERYYLNYTTNIVIQGDGVPGVSVSVHLMFRLPKIYRRYVIPGLIGCIGYACATYFGYVSGK